MCTYDCEEPALSPPSGEMSGFPYQCFLRFRVTSQERFHLLELVTRFFDDYQGLPEKEKTIEPVIVRLHEQGLSVGDAVKILRKLYSIPLSEAKMLLFEHPAWQKEREFSDRMIELMFSQELHLGEND